MAAGAGRSGGWSSARRSRLILGLRSRGGGVGEFWEIF